MAFFLYITQPNTFMSFSFPINEPSAHWSSFKRVAFSAGKFAQHPASHYLLQIFIISNVQSKTNQSAQKMATEWTTVFRFPEKTKYLFVSLNIQRHLEHSKISWGYFTDGEVIAVWEWPWASAQCQIKEMYNTYVSPVCKCVDLIGV